jgi:hypothetical protein
VAQILNRIATERNSSISQGAAGALRDAYPGTAMLLTPIPATKAGFQNAEIKLHVNEKSLDRRMRADVERIHIFWESLAQK